MIRRKKLTIFTDAKDDTTVLELKKMIEGKTFVLQWQYLFFFDISLDHSQFDDCYFNRTICGSLNECRIRPNQ